LSSSRPYLNYFVGGHGRETVGCAVKFARQNFDGVIQIGPLTCMPEIVAQSVLGQVGEKEGIPTFIIFKASFFSGLEPAAATGPGCSVYWAGGFEWAQVNGSGWLLRLAN
jgi:hypothetical protein